MVDRNKDNIINDADKTEIGDPNPDLFGGIFLSAQYKRFEFIANLFCYI